MTPEALLGLHHSRRADRARSRSAHRAVDRHARRDCVRHQPQHHDQPARRAQRIRAERATSNRRGSGWRGRGTTGRSRAKRGITCRSGAGSSLANRLRVGTIDPLGDRRGQRAVLQALLPRRRVEPSRLGTLRGRSDQRVRPADRRPLDARRVVGSPRCRCAGKLGAVAFVDFGNVWSEPWDFNLGDLRYAVGPGPALPDADRPGPRRLRLPAESDRRTCG